MTRVIVRIHVTFACLLSFYLFFRPGWHTKPVKFTPTTPLRLTLLFTQCRGRTYQRMTCSGYGRHAPRATAILPLMLMGAVTSLSETRFQHRSKCPSIPELD